MTTALVRTIPSVPQLRDLVLASAECSGYDPELFVPLSEREYLAMPAKRICARCPVRTQCLELAYRTGDDWAIMGGLTAQERRERRTRKQEV